MEPIAGAVRKSFGLKTSRLLAPGLRTRIQRVKEIRLFYFACAITLSRCASAHSEVTAK